LATKAEIKEQGRAIARASRQASIDAWRAAHDIPANVRDTTVWHLMTIEQIGKRTTPNEDPHA
jgi:hypothetical protein